MRLPHFRPEQPPGEQHDEAERDRHGVRRESDLCYRDYIVNELPRHEFLGEQIAAKLKYYPAVTREAFEYDGRDQRSRLTDLFDSGRMMEQDDADLPGGHSEGYDDTFKQVFRRFYQSIGDPKMTPESPVG